MIRLKRRVGSLPAGTETDMFDAAAEAAFLLDGTAEPFERAIEDKSGSPDYESMSRSALLRLAEERGIKVGNRAAKREIVKALVKSDEA